MDFKEFRQHVDTRFDRLESKFDGAEAKRSDHEARTTAIETDLSWLKGHVKLVTAISLAVGGSMAAILAHLVFGV